MQPTSPDTSHPEIYSIKRHGTTVTDCDAEPVQTPGCVQAHGALIALRASDFTVAQISENAEVFFGRAPEAWLDRPVEEILGEGHADRLRAFIDREPLERNPLYVFTLDTDAASDPLDVTAHTVGDTVVLEFEPMGRSDEVQPNHYDLVKRAVGRLQAAPSLQAFCEVAAEEVRAATGLDRVMVYRFHPDFSGEVFAEARRDDLAPWLGMRYPAHDIPQPAREIFKRIWVRPLPDARGALAEMVPLAHPDTGAPLEMTHCALRGASVMYTEYLENMRVAATLTMPILRDGELWGLFACHHYTPTVFPWPIRAACELLAQVTSLQLKTAEDRGDLEWRLQLEEVHDALLRRAAQGDLSDLVDGSPSLLDGLDAGGVAVFYDEQWWTAGTVPSEPALDGLAAWLRKHPKLDPADPRPVFATDHLVSDYPPAADYADVAAGLLAVPISRSRRNLLLWLRPETIETVAWAGNPDEMPTEVGPNGPRLTPRQSFELWQQSVRERSTPWRDLEVEAALRLRVLVMDFIVSRTEELAAVNADLSRSNEELDAFAYLASHDLKEPLRGIHKYAFQLAEAAQSGTRLDDADRERAQRLVRLAERMDDLINALLDYSRLGRIAVQSEPEDLNAVLQEAMDMLGVQMEASSVELRTPRPLPSQPCDRIRVREIFANLLSNAIKYRSASDDAWIEVGYAEPTDTVAFSDRETWPAAARTVQVFYVRDNGIGFDSTKAEQIFHMFKRLHGRSDYGGGSGMGLAIVKKLAEQHGGTVWAEGTAEGGAAFFFTLAPDPDLIPPFSD